MWKKALDTPGLARSEREVRKWEEGCCPEGEKGLFTPFMMASRAGKDAGGRGGPDEAVGKSSAEGDVWKWLKQAFYVSARRCLM